MVELLLVELSPFEMSYYQDFLERQMKVRSLIGLWGLASWL